jgi:hypothetical protein
MPRSAGHFFGQECKAGALPNIGIMLSVSRPPARQAAGACSGERVAAYRAASTNPLSTG